MTWRQRSLNIAARFLAPVYFTGSSRPARTVGISAFGLGSATGYSGAYPDRTCTC